MLFSSQGGTGAFRPRHHCCHHQQQVISHPELPIHMQHPTNTSHACKTLWPPYQTSVAASAIPAAHAATRPVRLHHGSVCQPYETAWLGHNHSMWLTPRSSGGRLVGDVSLSANKADKAESGVVLVQEAAEKIAEELRTGPMGQPGLQHRRELCDSGLPDTEMCELVDPMPSYSVMSEAISRGKWLFSLLILQSTSSFVLDSYQELLRDHLVVTLFLTMLVGAGGNAGNQSAIKIIRGMATGSIADTWPSARSVLAEQASVGLLLGSGLSLAGFVRVYVTNGNLLNASAISISLFAIVMTSVLLGTGLPFALTKCGVDPANAGTCVQVLMDILGVGITCFTCNLVLVQLASGLGLS